MIFAAHTSQVDAKVHVDHMTQGIADILSIASFKEKGHDKGPFHTGVHDDRFKIVVIAAGRIKFQSAPAHGIGELFPRQIRTHKRIRNGCNLVARVPHRYGETKDSAVCFDFLEFQGRSFIDADVSVVRRFQKRVDRP